MVKTLVMIRHGQRDNSRRELDNGLDDKGREQAKALKHFFQKRFSDVDPEKALWLASSPKLRCIETLAPIAKALGRSVDSHPGLDEQAMRESGTAFADRVQAFLKEWNRSKVPLTVISSHGDWLPLAAYSLLGLHLDVKKGSWLEIEWDSQRAFLKWYIPSFKHLDVAP
mgnify:CR=1 FL=1